MNQSDKPTSNIQKARNLLGRAEDGIVRFSGGAVGFIAEYKEHRKSRGVSTNDEARQSIEKDCEANSISNTDIIIRSDEELWALEEVCTEEAPPTYCVLAASCSNGGLETVSVATDGAAASRTPLKYPVIIPQRRPRDKSRGFARAYAPALAGCGISQETFLKFLKDFHTSSKSSPIFPVIQVSSFLVGQAPEATCKMLSMVIGGAALLAEKAQVAARTNGFLRQANEQLFRPAGLCAVIMKYKPASEIDGPQQWDPSAVQIQEVDVSNDTAKSTAHSSLRSLSERTANNPQFLSWFDKFRIDAGTIDGQVALPQSEPLIFPRATALPHSSQTFKGQAKDFVKVLGDYNDRRAQIRYRLVDPESGLAVPAEETNLKSSFARPSHPIHHNGLKGLVSGGRKLRTVDEEKNNVQLSRDTSAEGGSSEENSSPGLGAMLKHAMQKDILYLMIVDLPGDSGSGG